MTHHLKNILIVNDVDENINSKGLELMESCGCNLLIRVSDKNGVITDLLIDNSDIQAIVDFLKTLKD